MNAVNQAQKLSRFNFLKRMGLSGASLMAVYCGATLSSCTNEGDLAPANVGGPATYDMSTAAYAKLLSKGGFYVDTANNLVIANTSDNGYVAVTLVCTHEGRKEVSYVANKFSCSAHGATFDNTGKALSVASKALTTYKVSQTGNVLTVNL
jgi:cytochrome b6-f complex iron-sulfur subunit